MTSTAPGGRHHKSPVLAVMLRLKHTFYVRILTRCEKSGKEFIEKESYLEKTICKVMEGTSAKSNLDVAPSAQGSLVVLRRTVEKGGKFMSDNQGVHRKSAGSHFTVSKCILCILDYLAYM